ncbi:MAG: hypothetical protein ACRC0S_02190 [Fusobacteriaceae bacterium]
MREDLFEVGDEVWFSGLGWGIVVEIDDDEISSLGVQFKGLNSLTSFYMDGRRRSFGPRALFFEEIPIPESALVRKQWRAEKGEGYMFVSSAGHIIRAKELGKSLDNHRHELGNYFKTEYKTINSKFYKVFHEEV